MRKRKLIEGKESGLSIHGRKRTRQEVEKEIARNVTHTCRLQLLEDIPTPEGVEVFTPGAEVFSTSVTLRKVCLSNLPSVQLQRDIQTLMSSYPQIFKFDAFRPFDTSDQSNSQLGICSSSPSVSRLLEMVLGYKMNAAKTRNSFLGRTISWTYDATPVNTIDNVEFLLNSQGIIHSALQRLLQYFIALTNDGALSNEQIQKGLEWLSMNGNDSLLSALLGYKTTKMKTFMRKIFPAVVAGGNVELARRILEGHIDILNMTNHRPRHFNLEDNYTQQEKCMSIAVSNGDTRMVELLCNAGFSPRILYRKTPSSPGQKLPWDTGSFEALQTLLAYGAHSECFIVGKPQGFPLVDAAKSGSLEAVIILLENGSRVNLYVKDYFGTALQAAVWAGHLEVAEFLIAWGADINAPFGTQYQLPAQKKFLLDNTTICWSIETPLQIACAKDHVPLARLLLSYGAGVNLSLLSQIDLSDKERHHLSSVLSYRMNLPSCFQHGGLTPLQHSAKNGNIELSQLLLLNKANPNLRALEGLGDTPLQLSIRLGHLEVTRILMGFGADVNASPGRYNGRTALQAVAESGNIQFAQELLKRGADINAPSGYESGFTALQAAIKMRHLLMAGFLCISGADINAPSAPEDGLTAIQAAAEIGDLNLIKDLMLQGGEINDETAGNKAILASISHKNISMLRLLVQSGVPIDLQEEEDGMPPIIASVMNGWIDGVVYLLDHGADINSHCEWSMEDTNPLAWSIDHGDIEMIDLLLTRGASLHFSFVDYPTNDSLCLALLRSCSDEVIERLIEEYAKADPLILDPEVLATAVCYEHIKGFDCTRIARILKVMSKLPKNLYVAQILNAWIELLQDPKWLRENWENGNQVIELLLKAGADINTRDPSTRHTLLQKAICFNKIELANFLMEKGAEIQVPAGIHLGTPLQEAIRNKEIGFVHFLMEKGADVNAPPAGNGGATALQAAAKNRNRDLTLLLLKRGAEVNAPPAKIGGVTALQAAAIRGYIDIAIDLLEHGAHVAAAGAPDHGRTAIDGAAEHGREDMLQLLLNHYDGCEDLSIVCGRAATYAEKEGHVEIASWLRQYPSLFPDQLMVDDSLLFGMYSPNM